MTEKPAKRKLFWKLKKQKEPLDYRGETVNNLRSIFLDDTSLVTPLSGDLSPGDDVIRRGARPTRECKSVCITSENENAFFGQPCGSNTTMEQVHDIHVWHKNVLYRVNRTVKEGPACEIEFLKRVFALLLPAEALPEEITSAFRVLDDRREFQPIRQSDIFANGTLLKLISGTERIVFQQPEQLSTHCASSPLSHPLSSPPCIPLQRPDFLPAPLLRRKAKPSEPYQGKLDTDTDSPSTSDSMQTPHTNPPPNSNLVTATMHMGKNGERHLILHYPDGQSMATTAIPSTSGQFHLVPVVQQRIQGLQSGSANTALRLVQTTGDQQVLTGRRQPTSCVESHTHFVRNRTGQSVELTCTCPPELHHSLRQSQCKNATLTRPSSEEELIRRLTTGQSSRGSPPVVGWTKVAAQTSDQSNSPSGESNETFQESDSSGGSSQAAGFLSTRKGIVPPDVLLASVLNEQMKRPTKPPQTLEEAQYRIAYMESQLAQLTAWVQAAPNQDGLPDATTVPTALPSHPSFKSHASAKSVNSTESDYPLIQGESTKGINSFPENAISCLSGKKHRQLQEAFKGLGHLRFDLEALRHINASNIHRMNKMSAIIMDDITILLKSSRLGGHTPVREVQLSLDGQIAEYAEGLSEVDRWLADLEACIEELRVDALNRRCRVSVSEVETYALHLSRLSRRLASYKVQIPELRNASSALIRANEAEARVRDEYLRSEPGRLDAALSTCKHLTCTLFTLKRLGSVQENGISVNIPLLRTIRDPRKEDKQVILNQILQISPNHDERMARLACNEKTRERRRRMLSLHESAFFEASVEESEDSMRRLLDRLNDLLRDHLPPIPEDTEQKGIQSQAPGTRSATWICPIHQESTKPSGECCDFYETQVPAKDLRGSADGESSTTSNETNPPHTLPGTSRASRRARVVFSRTVLVDAGRETTCLNCPSDLDDTGDTGSEADDYQPWRRDQLHKGNRVVDIHPGLPRNQYIICDGSCGAAACAEGSCLARQKGATGSVLKTTTAYGPMAAERTSGSTMSVPRVNPNDQDACSLDSEEGERQLVDPTSVYEMRTHHQCCRLNNNNSIDSKNC